jgi:hypothetical protein
MKIQELIEMTEGRIKFFQNLINVYTSEGDIELILKYQSLLEETKFTLTLLKTLVI